jgi:uncharacterized LabA/DUF88 family protein
MDTYVYVDGFNFYYRVVKGTRLKWLDFSALCRQLLPKNKILRIKYFTARVSARPGDPDIPMRQQIYLRALRTIPNFEIIFGQFLQHKVRLPIADSHPIRFETVVRTEEKGSDVNLASHLIHDGHMKKYQAAVVITDDSDLAEALRLVKLEIGLVTGILTSNKRPSFVLHQYATFYKQIRRNVLSLSQFPPVMHDASGEFHKPANW